jgi:DNA-binding transcriptional ArsR family regulator
MEEKILIDRKTLKAISSDTRFDILKLLKKKQHTLSEISEKLKLSAPTIKEHLENLIFADLVLKKETERKWKYYSLTDKGEKLLEPKAITVLIAFVVSLVFALGSFGAYLVNLFSNGNVGVSKSVNSIVTESTVSATMRTMDVTTQNVVSQNKLILPVINNTQLFLIILSVLFFIITIIFLVMLIKQNRNEQKIKII